MFLASLGYAALDPSPGRRAPLVDCASEVTPVDPSPIRSPQKLHTELSNRYFANKHVVEIGTRNGDSVACFARTAASVTAIEMDTRYCRKLEERAKPQQTLGGGISGLRVVCGRFGDTSSGAPPLVDADWYTWWVGGDYANMPFLRTLCRAKEEGKLRQSAQALVLFDKKYGLDMSSLKELEHRNVTSFRAKVDFDEFSACVAASHANNTELRHLSGWSSRLCVRARGQFYYAAIHLTPAECGRLHRRHSLESKFGYTGRMEGRL